MEHGTNWYRQSAGGREPSPSRRRESFGLENRINSDLLNPSDALDLLHQVADLDNDDQPHASLAVQGSDDGDPPGLDVNRICSYKPVTDGSLTTQDIIFLLQR